MQYGPLLKKSGRHSTEPTTGDLHSTECEVSFYFALVLMHRLRKSNIIVHNRVATNAAAWAARRTLSNINGEIQIKGKGLTANHD